MSRTSVKRETEEHKIHNNAWHITTRHRAQKEHFYYTYPNAKKEF